MYRWFIVLASKSGKGAKKKVLCLFRTILVEILGEFVFITAEC